MLIAIQQNFIYFIGLAKEIIIIIIKKTQNVIKLKKGVGRDNGIAEANYSRPR